jgi:hypothetical protein
MKKSCVDFRVENLGKQDMAGHSLRPPKKPQKNP